MNDLEQRIGEVLNDPAQMQQILSIAQSLGAVPMQAEEAKLAPEEVGEAQQAPEAESGTPASLPDASALMKQMSRMDKKQEDLLNALRPFLRPSRRQKFDRALQIARLSQLAGSAMRTRADSAEKER